MTNYGKATILFLCILTMALFLGTGSCLAGWLAEIPTNEVPDGAGLNSSQAISADFNGDFHMVWLSNQGLKYRKFLSVGDWESAAQRVDPVDSDPPGTPCTAADCEGNVHVVWWSYNGGLGEIHYREKDVISGWDASPTSLGNPDVDEWSPSIAVDSHGLVHVVWAKERPGGPEIRYKCKDPIAGWDTGEIISSGDGVSSDSPFMCVDSEDNLHVVWVGGNNDLYYLKKTAGVGWDAEPTRLTFEGYENSDPRVAVDGLGCIHVIWTVWDDHQIKYKKYTPGYGWETVTSAFYPVEAIHGWFPALVADQSGSVHVIWEDSAIIYRRFDPGSGWSTPESLTQATDYRNPSIALDVCGNLGVIYAHAPEMLAFLRRSAGSAGVATDTVGDGAQVFAWQVCPNPFGNHTTVSYRIAASRSASLSVYDVTGRLVQSLSAHSGTPGVGTAVWGGENYLGERVEPGVYYLRLESGSHTEVKPVVLFK